MASMALSMAAPAPSRPGPSVGPGAVGRWSEVRKKVQQPDGSVRTSPPFKGAETSVAVSPPRPVRARAGGGLFRRPSRGGGGGARQIHPSRAGGGHRVGCASRAGSLRSGSSRSGKSSRCSSLDIARDGDISSSRCSSGCWETSTNSSEASGRRTPPEIALSPCASRRLMMPEPIRTRLVLPPALLDDEHVVESKADGSSSTETLLPLVSNLRGSASCGGVGGGNCDLASLSSITGSLGADVAAALRPGMPLKRDPYNRDGTHGAQCVLSRRAVYT
mmetsp:Transcript_44465/g.127416  ORF Transcript_44465/g.127416 Transcript_44465/m.127416 type:complete len:276 (-) Transcript_44465:67-894(-)